MAKQELTSIHWNDALQQQKQEKIKQEEINKKYQENLTNAHNEFWDKLGSEDFRFSDFGDTCSNWGIDEDDLLNLLI